MAVDFGNAIFARPGRRGSIRQAQSHVEVCDAQRNSGERFSVRQRDGRGDRIGIGSRRPAESASPAASTSVAWIYNFVLEVNGIVLCADTLEIAGYGMAFGAASRAIEVSLARPSRRPL